MQGSKRSDEVKDGAHPSLDLFVNAHLHLGAGLNDDAVARSRTEMAELLEHREGKYRGDLVDSTHRISTEDPPNMLAG